MGTGFWHQLRLLLWKNFTLKKRSPFVLLFELQIPLVLFFILLGIRKKQPAVPFGAYHFKAAPLPSSGLISIMQAFCDKGETDGYGFVNFPNSTVNKFLIQLDNIAQHNNFFQPNFTPNELDDMPKIYQQLVEHPVFLHDYFKNVTNLSLQCLLVNKTDLVQDLLTFNFSQKSIDALLASKINANEVYSILFGYPESPHKGEGNDVGPEIYHHAYRDPRSVGLHNFFPDIGIGLVSKFLKNPDTDVVALLEQIIGTAGVQIEFEEVATALKLTLLKSESLQYVVCEKKALPKILELQKNYTKDQLMEIETSMCQLSPKYSDSLSKALLQQISSKKIVEVLQLEKWDISLLLRKYESLFHALHKFTTFEKTLRDLAALAAHLPQDACIQPETEGSNVTMANSTVEEPSKKKNHNSQEFGILKLWFSMQKTICGTQSSSGFNNSAEDGVDDLDKMNLSMKQKEDIGILVHVLYSNPKVLYSPNTTNATYIIQKANTTFELLDKVTQYAQKALTTSQKIRDYLSRNTTEANLELLHHLHEHLQQYRVILNLKQSTELLKFMTEVQIFNKTVFLGLLDVIDNAACSWISMVQNISLNVFQGFDTEANLLNYFATRAYFDNVTVFASAVFQMAEDGSMPNHMIYKIRQNASFTGATDMIRNRFWFPGPRAWGYNYYQFGFVWIQDILERAMIDIYADRDVIEPGSYAHQFPYPCYMNDQFLFVIEHVMPLCLTISWVYSVAMLVQNIVHEKEQRLKEVMKMMGLTNGVHWVAWFITSFLQMSVTMTILTIILKCGSVLTYSNPFLIFIILEVFAIATIAFSFLVSVLYSKAKLAAACAGIIYFLSYVPYMYIAIREEAAHETIPAAIKSLASLMSTSAFGLGAKYFAFYEEKSVGVQWSNWDVSPVEDDEYTLFRVVVMMVIDSLVYLLLVWYIENVHPGSYGLPRPWYFPLTKSYWFGTKSDSDTCFGCFLPPSGLSVVEEDQACAVDGRNSENSRLFETEPSHLPLGVCIDSLVKIYKTGKKLAVNKLSLNLYEGQITSFLGHNGAGKTTTMSILTGLIPPTSGYAIIYGHDIRTEMDLIRKSLGLCPQHNVLFDKLTVEEHLWFYSRLKGMSSKDIQPEMEKLIEDLGLPRKRKNQVNFLSGGMKRKLSVAIAFVGGSCTVILDEPTAGVDPYARRAIWDLILKYKQGRTILLSTHHMDEADILGDRIAIISNGQMKCCGSSLFLKRNLGEGYHLTIVKKSSELLSRESREMERDSSDSFFSKCSSNEVTTFIRQHVFSAFLVSESKHELNYTLPSEEITKGNFEKLFQVLDVSLDQLHISSYGLKDTTLEEVFLKLADQGQSPESSLFKSESSDELLLEQIPALSKNAEVEMSDIGQNCEYFGARKTSQDGRGDYIRLIDETSPKDVFRQASCFEGQGSHFVSGNALRFNQFWAILVKRFFYTRRNWKGLFSQILLPAFFVCIAMSVALTAPKIHDQPPLILSPSQYFNHTKPYGNVIPFSKGNERFQRNNWSEDADPNTLAGTLHMLSGVGSTCILKDPGLSLDLLKTWTLAEIQKYFLPECQNVYFDGNSVILGKSEKSKTGVKMYPNCACSVDKTGFVCDTNYYLPYSFRTISKDNLMDITGQNETEYFLYTTDMFHLRRYGALSFGNVLEFVPVNFGNRGPTSFRKIALRNVVKVWYNNNGFHSLPTYLNAMNNAILRANLNKSKGDPAAYGITLINHPLEDTSSILSQDYILQGTDVLIAMFIIAAMSFVPASFVLFLVYERSNKAKHLQFVSGVDPVIYWLANYIWDMCNYVVPATCCVIILRIFDIPAYVSNTNFPAVVSLFLMYGWSITPVMYPASFLFNEPSTAYIFLIVINLFIGITCIVTSFLLEVFSYDQYLGYVHNILKVIFLMFPNYCLGRGLMDIAFNEYHNVLFYRTGQYDKMKSPFSWDLVSRNLVAMAVSGLTFFCITLMCEFNFFRKAKQIPVHTSPITDEDSDVAKERRRVLQGNATGDLLRLENLSKVYYTRKLGNNLAVDRLCLGVPEGECFGLLGVNGAGKSTTFKMLTGDIPVTAGNAYLNGYSITRDLLKVQQNIGYCPQFDALYDELTPREHLLMYARLRGIPYAEEKQIVDWALQKLALTNYSDKLSGTLSGGNKRKLSTAIALIGHPPVIFLDEPTTGMDPHSRRFLWNLILDLVKGGRSIILTSHSMGECEILCTRLAIMVNGHFKCLGSIQHLKNRFGDGYSITICTKTRDQVAPFTRYFSRTFPEAILKEWHHNVLHYELKSDHVNLAYVFKKMEEAQNDLAIENYSVCQNTLDNVFINFVKQQTEIKTEAAELNPLNSPLNPLTYSRTRHYDWLDDTLEDEPPISLESSGTRLSFLTMDVDPISC